MHNKHAFTHVRVLHYSNGLTKFLIAVSGQCRTEDPVPENPTTCDTEAQIDQQGGTDALTANQLSDSSFCEQQHPCSFNEPILSTTSNTTPPSTTISSAFTQTSYTSTNHHSVTKDTSCLDVSVTVQRTANQTSEESTDQSSVSKPLRRQSLAERSVQAAVIIQRWFRMYKAKLEIRRRCTWQIFTNIEFQNEKDQLGLSDFFGDLGVLKEALDHERSAQNQVCSNDHQQTFSRNNHQRSVQKKLENIYAAQSVMSEETEALLFDRPNKPSGLTPQVMRNIIAGVRQQHAIASQLLMSILDESFRLQNTFSNIRSLTTDVHRRCIVIGDLHGQFEDLLVIFEQNGIPSDTNPYIFNGDIVDRGRNSVELCAVILGFQLLYPHAVYINRGNHEDYLMNKRYGFEREVMSKYREKAPKLLRAFGAFFSSLPFATIVDKKVLVIHGGISDQTDLLTLSHVRRQHFVSILRAAKTKAPVVHTTAETHQIVNAVWSDPGQVPGCTVNATRGGGSVWGEDVTTAFLAKYDLALLVRSHECQQHGYAWTHGNKVLTIFSASNYYAAGSNLGAYAKFNHGASRPDIYQFDATPELARSATIQEQVGALESAAMTDLLSKIYAVRDELQESFIKEDTESRGLISVAQWADCMVRITKLNLPWRLIKDDLIPTRADGLFDYNEFQTSISVVSTVSDSQLKGRGVAEKLYKNIGTLDYIFRLIDVDNSGKLSHEEFVVACRTLNKYLGIDEQFDEGSAYDMARAVDLDKNGWIEFNEFVESFRLVRIL
eukprot:m.924180 g.924180  ORF g.924180 m.924180 type:complete len:777 (+) comp23767_c0_seq15:432-2762(+)